MSDSNEEKRYLTLAGVVNENRAREICKELVSKTDPRQLVEKVANSLNIDLKANPEAITIETIKKGKEQRLKVNNGYTISCHIKKKNRSFAPAAV